MPEKMTLDDAAVLFDDNDDAWRRFGRAAFESCERAFSDLIRARENICVVW